MRNRTSFTPQGIAATLQISLSTKPVDKNVDVRRIEGLNKGLADRSQFVLAPKIINKILNKQQLTCMPL